MTDDRAWYLIARDLNNSSHPVALAHFRFDLDNNDEVLYWSVFVDWHTILKEILSL